MDLVIRFRVTVHCDHPGCQASTPGDCRVEAGAFMPRGVYDVHTPENGGQWYRLGSRDYCEEHKADAGEREGEP